MNINGQFVTAAQILHLALGEIRRETRTNANWRKGDGTPLKPQARAHPWNRRIWLHRSIPESNG